MILFGSLIKTGKIVAILILIGNYLPLSAEVGCMDNSFHLKQWPDFKQYHYVTCNCPCEQYAHLAERDKCLKCGHYHAPQSKIIITPSGVVHE